MNIYTSYFLALSLLLLLFIDFLLVIFICFSSSLLIAHNNLVITTSTEYGYVQPDVMRLLLIKRIGRQGFVKYEVHFFSSAPISCLRYHFIYSRLVLQPGCSCTTMHVHISKMVYMYISNIKGKIILCRSTGLHFFVAHKKAIYLLSMARNVCGSSSSCCS